MMSQTVWSVENNKTIKHPKIPIDVLWRMEFEWIECSYVLGLGIDSDFNSSHLIQFNIII